MRKHQNSFVKYLQKMDSFGVKFNAYMEGDNIQYRSTIGGFLSIALYTLSILYFIYVCRQWAEGEILPKVQERLDLVSQYEFKFDENPGEFRFGLPHQSNIRSPFSRIENILTVNYASIENGQFTSTRQIFTDTIDEQNNNQLFTDSLKLTELKDIILGESLRINSDQPELSRSILMWISKCNQTLLESGSTCATEENISLFLNNPINIMYFRLNVRSFNYQSKQMDAFPKEVQYTFDPDQPTYQQILLKPAETTIDDGFLLSSFSSESSLGDFETASQSVSQQYLMRALGMETYMVFLFRLNGNLTKMQVSYPKLGEVLATIVSIIQMMFACQFILFLYNSKQMEDYLLTQVIKVYFPNFEAISSLNSKDSHVNHIIQQLKMKARQKLNILNIIYEISRLQFLFQSLLPRSNLKLANSLGIPLKYNKASYQRIVPANLGEQDNNVTRNREEIQEEPSQIITLQFDDFDILSQKLEPDSTGVWKEELQLYNEQQRQKFFQQVITKLDFT